MKVTKTGTFLLLLLIVSLSAAKYSRDNIQFIQVQNSPTTDQTPLYLPKREAVKLITLGYEQFFSNILWFTTLNYFGSKIELNQKLPWFSHMCELVTDLDSKATHVFEFCSTLMSWITREPRRSTELLNKAIENDPEYWRYYYLRGFNYWYFLEELDNAANDFKTAATLENAPLFLSSLASRLLVSKDEDSAIKFLMISIQNTKEEHAKKALQDKLQLAYVSRDIRYLNKEIHKFNEKHFRNPFSISELVSEGFIRIVPNDPYGEPYLYDHTNGKVQSASGGVGLQFHGKTAKTGFARHENWVSNEE